MTIRKRLPKYFFAIFLTLSITLLGFRLTVFDFDFYEKQFEKNMAYEKYGEEIVDKNSLGLINYLQRGYPLNTEFFNEKEKEHLKDVKRIVDVFVLLFYLSLILSLLIIFYFIYNKQYNPVLRGLFFSSSSVFVFALILFLLSLNFQNFFINFHKAFFSNNLWILNPETDNLVNLFPQEFFISALRKILLFDLAIAAVFFVFSLVKLRADIVD